MELKIGCDPEFFVFDRQENTYVSAHTLVPGTKENPAPLAGGGSVQSDGLAIEFNIKPASTRDEFVVRIVQALTDIRNIVPERYAFKYVSAAPFSREYLDGLPEHVRQLGCNPDFDAYTGKANNPPNANTPMRTGSGHIHIGWTQNQDVNDPDHLEACQMAVKALDATLGLYMTMLDGLSPRSILYGKAGAFRPKSYGVEYRTPSNAWLRSHKTIRTVHDITTQTINGLIRGVDLSSNNRKEFINRNVIEEASYFFERSSKVLSIATIKDAIDSIIPQPPEVIAMFKDLREQIIEKGRQTVRDKYGRFARKDA